MKLKPKPIQSKRTCREIIDSLKAEGWIRWYAFDVEGIFTKGKLVRVVFPDGTSAEGRRE